MDFTDKKKVKMRRTKMSIARLVGLVTVRHVHLKKIKCKSILSAGTVKRDMAYLMDNAYLVQKTAIFVQKKGANVLCAKKDLHWTLLKGPVKKLRKSIVFPRMTTTNAKVVKVVFI